MADSLEQGVVEVDEAPFILRAPATPGPFVFASPHSGDIYPGDMGTAAGLGRASLRSAEDALVDRLIAPGQARGATLLLGLMGRAWVDLNRDPDDLDPVLIEGLDGRTASPRAAAGYGVIPRLTGDGRPLYGRRLGADEAAARIARVHAPYHAALDGLMRAAHARHGAAFLVDWHSMPARATQGVGGARGPDVVLGDRHGASCTADLTRQLRRAFEALGWRVALNQPYSGGWTTQRWGRPDDGFHAVQIELNRALYLDETTMEPGVGWSRCAAGVARVIEALLVDPPVVAGA
ncbi:N-formylglutamate amidohydrolase [Brevundimonas basaltis]|uniref:N-formylglutamate amidohydrolase n=1 Tax=Brevundimonas basaltis TaxID=472166 RepID=A0A7W8I023_9CAUL|nr:N-formylglutamate amidohydrolase [Brevundimonas basaltis]MBB5293046.1 N-formylglutamate amidohydrolase [Brevundimonas basaltis]